MVASAPFGDVRPVGHVETAVADAAAAPVAAPAGDHALHDLSGEYAFLNHGALFSYGGFDPVRDPIRDWAAEGEGRREALRIGIYRAPVFRGLDAPLTGGHPTTWGHALIGVRRPLLDSLLVFLCGIRGHDPARRAVRGLTYRPIWVPDPVVVDRHGHARAYASPAVEVAVLLVAGSDGSCDLMAGTFPPRVVPAPPDPVAAAEAAALYGDDLPAFAGARNAADDAFLRRRASRRADG
jgi:hypothetical protein